MKKVLAIHDISTIGKASLTVVIPILSAMGLRVCPLPTMVLSSITGEGRKPVTLDLTEFMRQTAASMNEEFDWVYSGFLGSSEQTEIVAELAAKGKNVLIDPVMGDNGQLYSTMNVDMVRGMKKLIKHADIITPNWTEARFLTDEKFNNAGDIAKALEVERVVITSVPNKSGDCVDIAVCEQNHFEVISGDYAGEYSGAGDTFASVLLGKISQGAAFGDSVRAAAEFVRLAANVGEPQLGIEKVLDKLKNL